MSTTTTPSYLNTHTEEIVISHNPFLAQPSSAPLLPQPQQVEKRIVYFDDYSVSPPSYDVAQKSNHHHHNNPLNETRTHTSDTDYGRSEDIPLHTYTEDTFSSVSDTAPLMMEEAQQPLTSDCTPSAPSLDQVQQDNQFESMDDKTPKRKHKLTSTRIFIACCVWFVGVTFMSVSVFAYECFDKCQTDEECHKCLLGVRKGGMSLAYAFFLLGCIFATYRTIRFTLSV